jgi:hypothetical protein
VTDPFVEATATTTGHTDYHVASVEVVLDGLFQMFVQFRSFRERLIGQM